MVSEGQIQEWLKVREINPLALLAFGWTKEELADRLDLDPRTIRYYATNGQNKRNPSSAIKKVAALVFREQISQGNYPNLTILNKYLSNTSLESVIV